MLLLAPELILTGAAFTVLLLTLFLKEKDRRWLAPAALAGIFLTILCLGVFPKSGSALGGRFVLDPVRFWFKAFFSLASFLTVLISMDGLNGRVASSAATLKSRGEFLFILLLNLTGMFFLTSATELISLYVSLELATIPLFVLTAWRRNAVSTEAGLKYVVLGSLSSAFLLYGFGLLYGLTGEMGLAEIGVSLQQRLHTGDASLLLFWFSAALVMAGIGFKLTLVPFHFWAADVYEGAPTPVTAYLSVTSKAAGLTLFFQLFYHCFGSELPHWGFFFAMLAGITMTFGNLVAIVQTNIKRFMAFSSISQAGYLILGFLGHPSDGIPAMLYYLLVYIVTNITVFSVIIYFSNQTGKKEITDYRGLSRTRPLIALAMMIGLFGLAGIPPLSGFVGKFFLFSVASKAGYHFLVALAAVNSTVSLYYYLRIVRQMYIEPLPVKSASFIHAPASTPLGCTMALTAIASVLLGVIPFFYEAIRASAAGWVQ